MWVRYQHQRVLALESMLRSLLRLRRGRRFAAGGDAERVI